MKSLRPLLFIVSLISIVGLACGGSTTPPTVTAFPTQEILPTNPPPQPTQVPPTEAPATEAPVTEPPAPEAQAFFTEEFDVADLSNWSSLLLYDETYSDPDKVTVEAQDGRLIWNFDTEGVDYYVFYDAFDYEDVKVVVNADNRGKNNTAVGLVCRYTPDVGWYQFRIANNGLYVIEYYEILESGKIQTNRIANGGSNDINQGKAVNEYSITCQGEELTLNINGAEVTTIKERTYGLRSGQVGVAVSSLNVLPILVEMDWIEVSEP